DRAAVPTQGAFASQADRPRTSARGRGHTGDADIEAAIAAAAADGLGHEGRRAIPSRPDGPFDVGQDLPTVAAAAAAAPKAQGDGAAARTRNTEGGGNREAAVAAAAAHGLGKETGGLLSMGADETLVAGL